MPGTPASGDGVPLGGYGGRLDAVLSDVAFDVGFGQHDAPPDAAESDPSLLYQAAQQAVGEHRVGGDCLLKGEVAARFAPRGTAPRPRGHRISMGDAARPGAGLS